MKNKPIYPIGDSWENVRNEIFTADEIAESDARVALLSEIINIRKSRNISQKELEKLSGVKQPVIARLETGKTDPQLSTILKLLNSVGKTIKIVPLETNEKQQFIPARARKRKLVAHKRDIIR